MWQMITDGSSMIRIMAHDKVTKSVIVDDFLDMAGHETG